MFRTNSELKNVMTPSEYRNEIVGGYIFVLAFPILMLAMWVITPA